MTHNKPLVLLGLLLVSGCSSISTAENKATPQSDPAYHIDVLASQPHSKVSLILAFSGGGTRAAALSYGVMQQLQQTMIDVGRGPQPLLEEVDIISSVSGGSFTAAYYGLFGEQMFTEYEDAFLYKSITDDLISTALSPLSWFSNDGRTEIAERYFQDNIFGDATFADLHGNTGPFVIINASDITTGSRFSFIQNYFDLLCSDISRYPVSNAVTASAAVPVLFNSVILENYEGCEKNTSFHDAIAYSKDFTYQTEQTYKKLQSYKDTKKNQYIHLVDGGITDNLGLLAIYDIMELGKFHQDERLLATEKIVIISVDAATEPDMGVGQAANGLTIKQTLSMVTDIQLHRYNDATVELIEQSLQRWSASLSVDGNKVEPYFIRINLKDLTDQKQRGFFNQIPTDFSLDEQQVDQLIAEGGKQLANNVAFIQLLKDIAKQ
ncbi:patatin-like phospholipase family protein [Motilimonas pumila]|nr:patatin-like phospholipase family protein [Motilimonas pumila]